MGCYLSAKSEAPLPYLHKRKDINVVFIATATVYADLGMGCVTSAVWQVTLCDPI